MDVSKNSGTRKSSILIGFSLVNHPCWDAPILGNTHRVFFGAVFFRGNKAATLRIGFIASVPGARWAPLFQL